MCARYRESIYLFIENNRYIYSLRSKVIIGFSVHITGSDKK